MLSIEGAMELLEKHCTIQDKKIHIPVEEAYGFITAFDICSQIHVPGFPKAAMDGYAVNSRDVCCADKELLDNPISLRVIGEVLAGEYCSYEILTGEAVRIMTGAMMPKGADCVIKQEDTDYGMQEVKIYKGVLSGENYCKLGEDITKGDLIIKKHTKLNSVHIGILSSIGMDKITVLAPMRVSLLQSGDELTAPGEPLKEGNIYNSIGAILKTKLKEMKLEVHSCHICPDDKEILKEKIEQSIHEADIIITTGGVSVGKKDLIPGILKELFADVLFHGVKIKPGTPVMMSLYKGKMILSLSGNPFAALVTFDVFFSKIASLFMKNETFMLIKRRAVYQGNTLKANKQRRYIRASTMDGKVSTSSVQSSSVLSVMAELNCYIIQLEDTIIENGMLVEIC